MQEAYGKLAALMDPEKNSDARAIPLQDIAMKAFRTLANPDKRDRCMETYVQVRCGTVDESDIQNHARQKFTYIFCARTWN